MNRLNRSGLAGSLAVSVVVIATLAGPGRAFTADKPTSRGAAAAPSLTVTAKLVDIPGKFPPDDLYDYAYVMRYEVVGGPMDKQSILVAHYKPRQPRGRIADDMKAYVAGKVRSFKPGDVHKLLLAPDLKRIWKGALVDEYAATDRKSTRYWALVTDPA